MSSSTAPEYPGTWPPNPPPLRSDKLVNATAPAAIAKGDVAASLFNLTSEVTDGFARRVRLCNGGLSAGAWRPTGRRSIPRAFGLITAILWWECPTP
jgi:hypothetical protein